MNTRSVTEYLGTPFLEWCSQVLGLSFTPYQRAVARVMGGADPEGPLEREVWGFEGPIEPHLRAIIALRLGRRGFKTTLSSAFIIWKAMTSDLSEARGGAPIMCPIVAPSEPATKIALNMCVHMASSPLLKDCINVRSPDEGRRRQAITTTSLHLLRPHDGMSVEVRAVVASAGGKNLVGYHIPAGVIDEAERLRIDSDAGITDTEQLDAMAPSLLPGGSIPLISTPYDWDSYMHKHVERNHGHPVDGLAAIATTRQLRPDSQMVLDMVAREMLRRPDLARRDFECVPLGREDAFFRAVDVDACTIDAPPMYRDCVSGGTDLGFITDGSGGLTLSRHDGALWQTWEYLALPQDGRRLLPSIVRRNIGDGLIAAGADVVAADVHEFASLCEDLIPRGIQVAKAPTGIAIGAAFGLLRELLRSGTIRVLPTTAQQLKKVRTQASGEPHVDRGKDGHCDLVSALVAAVWLDRRFGPLTGGNVERPAAFKGGWTH